MEKAIICTILNADVGTKIKNKWIISDMFVDAIRAMGVVSEQINFSKAIFNRLLPKMRFNDLYRFDMTNTSRIFHHTIYYFIVNNPGTEHPE